MNIVLTGERPTGRLHIGHYVGSLQQRLQLQDDPTIDKMYIMIADAQALTDNAGNVQKVKDNIIEVALDYLAVGLIRNRFSGARTPARLPVRVRTQTG